MALLIALFTASIAIVPALAINPDGSLNNTGNGAAPGEVVVAYLTGIGDVAPPSHGGCETV